MITICGNLLLFLFGQMENKVLREPFLVPFDTLVEGA